MKGQPAKVLGPADLRLLFKAAAKGRYPVRNRVMVLLSVKAGLRACEIANLTWPMVLNANSAIGDVMELPAKAAKMGGGRRIPIHADLKKALQKALAMTTDRTGPVVRSERKKAMEAKAVVNWFKLRFLELGLQGCSSHSGRRTFVTKAARSVHRAGGSLRDVQILAGHRSIKTTQGYIEGDSNVQRRLMKHI